MVITTRLFSPQADTILLLDRKTRYIFTVLLQGFYVIYQTDVLFCGKEIMAYQRMSVRRCDNPADLYRHLPLMYKVPVQFEDV